MRKSVLTVLLCLSALLASQNSNAQRLIHYWHFNTFTAANIDTLASTGCTFPIATPNRIRSLHADYSTIDTSKARIWYTRQTGVSNAWPQLGTYGVCYTFLDDNSGGSTVNAQFGTPGGNYLRPRNPSDSMELRFYIPSTNYQNITVSFAAQNSSTASGPRYFIYDYSVDSGATWIKTGLNKLKDSAWSSAFNLNTIVITDPLANNNPKLVFRVRDSVNTTGSSGNLRYDNVTVSGDTLIPATLIHFWNFNTFTGVYTNPNFYPVAADYSILDTSKAKVLFGTIPGTSATNPTFFDFFTSAGTDFDTVNARFGVPGGNGIRMRNPNDSTQLFIYMPTTHYKNIKLKFATQSSSVASGDSIQIYDYSVDSGVTWRIAGLNEIKDSAYLVFKLVSIAFSDPATYNNPKLVFRIKLRGKNTGTSGNNRFDNISVEGDSIQTVNPSITTTAAAYGPLCSALANPVSVAFTSAGTITGPYSVQITNSNGTFPTDVTSNLIGSGTSSPITATIPAGITPGSVYRLRVVNSFPVVFGSDNGSDINLSSALNPNTGVANVCSGLTTALSNVATGGTWTTSNGALATVGSLSGVVTGVAAGTPTITYSVPSGCKATTVVTVNQSPSIIVGSPTICVGSTATLTDTVTGGTWTSSNTFVAGIGSASGIINAVAPGSVTITYTLPSGCFKTMTLTVNPLPGAITGTASVCAGATTTLSDAGGGSWSSSNTALASVGSTSVVAGISAGAPTITYALATGCISTVIVTVNAVPDPISGGATGCVGTTTPLTDATAFGAWSSSNTAIATVGSSTGVVTGAGVGVTTISYTLSTGCRTTTTISINSLPSAITTTSTFVICAGATTTLNNAATGGTWSSSNTAVATVDPSTGVVTGVVAGTPVITYTLSSGCMAFKTITVNALPAPIAGLASLYCLGTTTTLTDATSGGTWTSSLPSIATIGSGSGLVTGIAPGTTTITYALPTGCSTSLIETVNPTPAAITGNPSACVGAATAYSDVTAFGAWSSSNTAVATIGSGSGIATGVATGTATISYSVFSGCVITTDITVNPAPAAIAGTAQVCAGGAITTLTTTSTGGSWSSSVPGLANVDALSGVVTGVAAGNPVITYTLPTGCIVTTPFTVNPLPAPIGGVTSVYCIGSTATLTDFIAGGTWTSGDPAVATISSTGLVTGVAAGSSTITYALPTGCYTTYVENITSTPAPITGAATTCISTTTTFSDVTAFGAWSSSAPSVATVGSGTGVVTGVTAGTATITYQLSPACLITTDVTVNPQPAAISGTTNVCIGSATTLTDAGGGTWTSSIPALASVGAGTGIVTGVVAGTVAISYTLPTGCVTTTGLTINPLPVVSGANTICTGLPSPLTGNIAGGTWSSSNIAVAAIGSASGLLTGATPGITVITYTLPTGCMSTYMVTVNPPPAAITGTMQVCNGLSTTLSGIGGGGWYSSDPAIASVGFGTGIVNGLSVGTATITYSLGTSCISTAVITVNPLPAAITGTAVVCQNGVTTLADATGSGSWSSSNTALATVDATSGIVTGVAAGMPDITFTVTGTGCIATAPVTVNPVSPITGTDHVCNALSITLADTLTSGTWTSSNTSVAAIDPVSGVVSGTGVGAATITYALPTGCFVTKPISVDPAPVAIAGNLNVCLGSSNLLTDASAGGSWSSTTTTVATADSAMGAVTGIALGTSVIVYTLPSGCTASTTISVDPLPAAITGTATACAGLTATLTDSTTGGAWSNDGTTVATIGSAGTVTGISAGTSAITYTLPTGCFITSSFTVNPLPALHTVTGGGNYCSGTGGLHIGLNGSDSGIRYQLYTGLATAGSPMNGTGSALDFGLDTAAGVYTISATDTTTGCVSAMTGSENITILPLPTAYNVTGGGGYCAGGTGVHVFLGNSDAGIRYQLMSGSTAIGAPLTGTGSSLDYGLFTTAATYKVVATNPSTTCVNNMNDSAIVSVDTLFSPVVTFSITPAGRIMAGDTVTITAHVTGGGSSVAYQWLNNITYISGATNAAYTSSGFHNMDSVTCLVTASSACGSTITPKSTVLFIHDVAVPQIGLPGSNLTLVPNPNKGTFTIMGSVASQNDEVITLEVTNMTGQVIYRQNAKTQNGELNEQVLLGNTLANGMYLLNVRSGAESKVFHFVIEQ